MWEKETIRHLGLEAIGLVDNSVNPSPRKLYNALMAREDRYQIMGFVGRERLRDLVTWPVARGGELTDIGILRHMLAGNIRIDPFDIRKLQSTGYDVSLGNQYYVCLDTEKTFGKKYPKARTGTGNFVLFNPADNENVQDFIQGPEHASLVGDLRDMRIRSGKGISPDEWERGVRFLEDLGDDDQVIIIPPNSMILGHTIEFIGGRNVVDTTISGKSTTGRLGIEVCSDANKGDVGFDGRWTLEIANKHPESAVLLIVGQPIATITFMEVERPVTHYAGRYSDQGSSETWKPESMRPRWRRK